MQRWIILAACGALGISMAGIGRAQDGDAAPNRTKTVISTAQAQLPAGAQGNPRDYIVVSKSGDVEVYRLNNGFSGWAVPSDIDPADKTQRVLLLTPGGPLVVQWEITIDGRPYQTRREELLDEALSRASKDANGNLTWEAVLESGGITPGRMAFNTANKSAREQYMRQVDKNGNGLVERGEARLAMAIYANGPTFSAMPVNMMALGGAADTAQKLFEILDADKDQVLSAEEIASAPDRLVGRDANDNEILEMVEITGRPYGGMMYSSRTAGQLPRPLVQLLGVVADWPQIYKDLKAKYAEKGELTQDKIPVAAGLVKQLDQNDNGQIDEAEVARLNDIPPHLSFTLNLGKTGDLPSGLTLTETASLSGLEKSDAKGGSETCSLSLPGIKLDVVSGNVAPVFNYQATAQAMLNQYDKDKNGYLERSELEGQQQQVIQQQFDSWDANKDGKVYVEEITKSYERMQEMTWHQISIGAVDAGNSLLAALDANGDSRLGLREIRAASQKLLTFDKNQDGRVEAGELPASMRLAIARSNMTYQLLAGNGQAMYAVNSVGGSVARQAPSPSAGPEWFVRMDRNGDGDVTPREFPGEREQFDKLDANRDGFIERAEAEKAEQP